MEETQDGIETVVGHAPVVWRSTLRGVLVHDGDEVRLLQGLGAMVWLTLSDGPMSSPELRAALEGWEVDVADADVAETVSSLLELGLLRS